MGNSTSITFRQRLLDFMGMAVGARTLCPDTDVAVQLDGTGAPVFFEKQIKTPYENDLVPIAAQQLVFETDVVAGAKVRIYHNMHAGQLSLRLMGWIGGDQNATVEIASPTMYSFPEGEYAYAQMQEAIHIPSGITKIRLTIESGIEAPAYFNIKAFISRWPSQDFI